MALIFEQRITKNHSVCVVHDKDSESYVYLFPTDSRGTCIASKRILRGPIPVNHSEINDWVQWGIDKISPEQYN